MAHGAGCICRDREVRGVTTDLQKGFAVPVLLAGPVRWAGQQGRPAAEHERASLGLQRKRNTTLAEGWQRGQRTSALDRNECDCDSKWCHDYERTEATASGEHRYELLTSIRHTGRSECCIVCENATGEDDSLRKCVN